MSGYVGVGGGFIMVPLMLSLIHIPMKLASGTSLIAVMILGAMLVKRVPERALRFIFGGFLIIAAIVLFLNEFGILG